MITVFYANQVYGQYTNHRELRKIINPAHNNEIYQGGFIHTYDVVWHTAGLMEPGWYRCDGTPYPDDQIDPRMKAWILLLG